MHGSAFDVILALVFQITPAGKRPSEDQVKGMSPSQYTFGATLGAADKGRWYSGVDSFKTPRQKM